MKSKTFITFEVDDAEIACDELCQQVEKQLPLLKNSVGILLCYSDMDMDILAKSLYQKLKIPFIGATAIATMDDHVGFHELAVTLVIMTADDCEFNVAVSDSITSENIVEEISKTYQKVSESKTPGLVYAIPPYQLDIMLDTYTDVFTKIAPQIPFIGGLPSYNGNGDSNATIFNDQINSDKLVLLAISGNIKPVFSLQNVLENKQIQKRKVRKAKGNVIYQVDNLSFIEYLREIGMPLNSIADINSTVSLVANPLLVEDTREGFGNNFKYLRSLHAIDFDEGSGTAIGRIPEGSYISIHPLGRNEISESALIGINDLNKQIEEQSKDGYEYSTVLGISCIGRYVIMTPNGEVETNGILSKFKDNLTLAGFYSYGEICPLNMENGIVSFSHNESLVLCAF